MPALAAALERLCRGQSLGFDEMRAAVGEILDGAATDIAISAFLTALRFQGETADELAGAVAAARDRMIEFDTGGVSMLDTCGTGGDCANIVNVSTAAAVVVAACGVPVAKHGNRAASGNSGSAEVLTELGIGIEAEPEVLRRCLSGINIAFLFALRFHPALRSLVAVRRVLPFRTLFNLVGPLANPARPRYQLVGVAGEHAADLVAEALLKLGVERAAIVTGSGDLDEVTLAGPTSVRWIERGELTRETWEPRDFGLPCVSLDSLLVSGPQDSATRLWEMLAGQAGPVRDIVLANAGAALRVSGRTESLIEGAALAASAIDSGAARELVEKWRALNPAR
jgi:anthranilate phosphoribosyltransferase